MSLLLVTDLDNTLVGDDAGTSKLNQWLSRAQAPVYLAYSTGRSYDSARRLMAERALLEPDYWITAVGTEIYSQKSLDPTWAGQLSEDWDLEAVSDMAARFKALERQPEPDQGRWKVSFYLDNLADAPILEELQGKLTDAGLAAQVIFSGSRDVDIVPDAGNKGNATTYLRRQLGMKPDETLVCGDSGNDISLYQQQERGVIVGNALPELLSWYQQQGQSHHYLARTNYAWGILEGLKHFQFLRE
jgi:sucrose-6F-phosphate phosphohydrolase